MEQQERSKLGWNSWASARTVAKDRQRWRQCIGALCASGHEEDRWGEVNYMEGLIIGMWTLPERVMCPGGSPPHGKQKSSLVRKDEYPSKLYHRQMSKTPQTKILPPPLFSKF